MSRRLLAISATLVSALVLSGCGVRGLQSFHLPGGAAGSNAYEVTVIFRDVTALAAQSSVRVNDVPVGDVDKVDPCLANAVGCPAPSVENNTFLAKVTVRIKKSVTLPENAVAAIKQTSLLGEKYVELSAPSGQQATGKLAPGSFIQEERSRSVPDLEEVFGALSLLLNGGGLEQLQTISTELSAALTGRESNVKGFLHQIDTFIGGLDANKSEIVRALDSLNRLSKSLVDQKQTIATALTNIAPGLKILADQEPDLAKLLEALARLGDVASRVIRETKADTVASLQSLDPVLTKLAQAGTYLPQALEVLVDYPFPRNVSNGIFGDYTGLLADIDLQASLTSLFGMGLLMQSPQATTTAPPSGATPKGKTPKLPKLPIPLPTLPSITGNQGSPNSDGLLGLLMRGMQ
ncbi:MAG: phospholipid/cholesterol/gamma-HCH transport system substrate-binding protein [Frankiales bacterium]|jgi:phospholipid/cholesterol/gamma-HCH transport system substrate-binding protein|nr:phospholipid/cholesterol/gamma-HCH transport system substrate-binding protein [Frankiales bacterium]